MKRRERRAPSPYYASLNNTSGQDNTANGTSALSANTTGIRNTASGLGALGSHVTGDYNTAAGYGALQYNTNGSFNTASGVSALRFSTTGSYNTADGLNALYATTGNNNIGIGYVAGFNLTTGSYNIDIGNQGVAGESGIIRIGDTNYQTAAYIAGNVYASGNVYAMGFQLTSDRNAKEDFTTISASEVLAKVASLPVTAWSYKADKKGVRHIGPMAQDFQSAFQLSADDKHISVVDEGGVALAAIQGLNKKLQQKDAEITELKQGMAELKPLVQSLTTQK